MTTLNKQTEFTLYDLRGPWASDEVKMALLKGLNKRLATQRQSLLDEVMGVIGEDDKRFYREGGQLKHEIRNEFRAELCTKLLALKTKYQPTNNMHTSPQSSQLLDKLGVKSESGKIYRKYSLKDV